MILSRATIDFRAADASRKLFYFFIDRPSVFDPIQCNRSVSMINPVKNPVTADAVFLESFEIIRHIFQRMVQKLRVQRKPLNLFDNSCSSMLVECLNILIEFRRCFYLIQRSFLRLASERVFPSAWLLRARRIFCRKVSSLERKKSSISSSTSSKALAALDILLSRDTGTSIVLVIRHLHVLTIPQGERLRQLLCISITLFLAMEATI